MFPVDRDRHAIRELNIEQFRDFQIVHSTRELIVDCAENVIDIQQCLRVLKHTTLYAEMEQILVEAVVLLYDELLHQNESKLHLVLYIKVFY